MLLPKTCSFLLGSTDRIFFAFLRLRRLEENHSRLEARCVRNSMGYDDTFKALWCTTPAQIWSSPTVSSTPSTPNCPRSHQLSCLRFGSKTAHTVNDVAQFEKEDRRKQPVFPHQWSATVGKVPMETAMIWSLPKDVAKITTEG